MIFNLNSRVFRAALPILNGGVNGMVVYDNSTLILGDTNGELHIVNVADLVFPERGEEVTVEAWRLAPFNVKVRLAQHFRFYLMLRPG